MISVPTETFTYMISNEGQKIRVSSVGKNTAASMISSSPEAPYFEFMTDKGIVSSELPVWEFKTSYVREMCNGGTEITSVFAGDGIAEGMELTLVHQYFHGSSLIRERMGLRSASGKTAFALKDGKNHFIYPRYTLPQAPESVTEWRMGTFMEENHIFITDSILHDFDAKMREIAMVEGFNPELASRQKEILTQLYGTLDRSALVNSIAHGDFANDMNRHLEAAALKSQWNALIPSAQTGSTPRREENQIAQR